MRLTRVQREMCIEVTTRCFTTREPPSKRRVIALRRRASPGVVGPILKVPRQQLEVHQCARRHELHSGLPPRFSPIGSATTSAELPSCKTWWREPRRSDRFRYPPSSNTSDRSNLRSQVADAGTRRVRTGPRAKKDERRRTFSVQISRPPDGGSSA